MYLAARATMKASKIMVRERYRGALNEDLDRGDLIITPSSGVSLSSHMKTSLENATVQTCGLV